MLVDKQKIAMKILSECFWGDYSYSPEKLIKIAEEGSLSEKNFLFGKVVQNALFVSYCLRIFHKEDLYLLFEKYEALSLKKEIEKKIVLSKAVLFGNIENTLLEDYQWKK